MVQDHEEGLPWRRVSVDDVQELQQLLVAMARITGAAHGAVAHSARREQAGGAVGLVVMRQGAASPLLHRHARVCSIQRVDLRLFIHAHHFRQCLHTPRVLRPLERFDPVRGHAVRVLDPRHAGMADSLGVRQGPPAPGGRVWRRRMPRASTRAQTFRGDRRWALAHGGHPRTDPTVPLR